MRYRKRFLKPQCSAGISLLELLLYLGGATLVLIGILSLLSVLSQSWLHGRARAVVEESVRTAVERMRAETEATQVVSAPAYAQGVRSDSPIGYWRLNETSGNAIDISGNANDGTYSAGVTRGVSGAVSDVDAAATFNSASSGTVTITDVTAYGVTRITVEAWVNITSWISGAAVFNRKTAGNIGGYSLDLTSTSGTMQFRIYDAGAWRSVTMTGFTIGVWHHVAGTYDGSSILLYRNGIVSTPTTYSGSINNPASPLVQIGKDAAAAAYFNGTIDDVAVYNRALAVQEILDHYRDGIGDVLGLDTGTASKKYSGYAWSENFGWLSFDCVNQLDPWDCDQTDNTFDNYGVTRTLDTLSGFGRTQIGFVSFNCASSPNLDPCKTADYRVTVDAKGDYHGWAWGEEIGWISFNCADRGGSACSVSNYKVYETATPTGAEIHGWAWSENYGWISFHCAERGLCDAGEPQYKVSAALGGTRARFSVVNGAWTIATGASAPQNITDATNVLIAKCANWLGYFQVIANAPPARPAVRVCFQAFYRGPGSDFTTYSTQAQSTFRLR